MKKLRVSTWIGIAGVTIAVGSYYGLHAFSAFMLRNEHFSPVAPKHINLVGISPGAGYRIIIANDVAQLVETQGGFGGKESSSEGATEGSIKKRVPMRELLGVLRGDGKSLGNFVMIMNNMQEKDDWPPTRVPWKKDDLEKAFNGDAALKAKLEHDLNVRLDGTPIVPLNRNSLENGIFILSPVEMTVKINGEPTLVKGETMEPYKPAVIKATEAHYQDKARVDDTMIGGYYADEVRQLQETPSRKEDIVKSIRNAYSKTTMTSRLEAPKHLLDSATVVLNEDYIKDASYTNYQINGKAYNDLTISLKDEGRRRLWKYTQDRVGSQILLIADDVAIAAPRIEHELALSEFTVTQMPDEVLVRDAVNSIKGSKDRMAGK